MKNNIFKIVTAALGVFCLASCGENVSKTDIKPFEGTGYQERDFFGIKQLNRSLFVGQPELIVLDSMPQNFLSKVKFESLNNQIVEVSATGLMNPVSEGSTKILVKDDQNNLLGKLNILVVKDDETNTRNALQNIKDLYKNGYVEPTKVHKMEYSYEEYYRDGVIDHGYTSFDETYYDKTNAIFYLGGDDVMRYTRGGAREAATGHWHFQVLGRKTRMVHITENAKNYYDFNSSAYGTEKYKAIEDILNLFFVSGSKIINDMLEEYSGKDDFLNFCDFYKTDPNLNIYADNDNNISANIVYKDEPGVVDTKDELQYLDMYEGTEYIENDNISFIYNSNKCTGYDIDATYDYQYDGSNWQRDFHRSMEFDEDFEPEMFDYEDKEMQELGFRLVDQMYDL
ncbi:MAG: Ig-like domain-containing protein [Firmicutes bacterium]|nr:Ig-like domain-containing protein [Candidatus Fiminaster equi]